MTRIDINLSSQLQQQLALPHCAELRLPKPKLPQIRLPTGGSIKAIADLTRGIPSDCSLNVNIALQLAPIMASIECLVKVLALVKPLIDVVKALNPPDLKSLAQAVPDFLEAAKGLAGCLLVPTPLAMIPFVKDILQLIIAMLRCLIGQMRSILGKLAGLELKIASARASGNTDVLASLECARENFKQAMDSTMMGIEPIAVLLELAGPFMGIAGVDPIALPAMAGADELAAVEQNLAALQQVVDALQAVVDVLP
ncbi:hypothetical protein [Massilia sp. BJB1822]|uniref:hypothetical protein n=1 Tax=Massilia sp. BJB1822 TaxID=2744470 RepID=UPI0015932CD6|nr:hypothetical protein [Massilia sp. BJB1822]NVD97971.1 hypothetical protein [Massilia sp. BJB1822]